MKKLFKNIGLLFFLGGFTSTLFAQEGVGVSATATASATIVEPISISRTVDMDFGYLAVASSGGTIVLTPESTRTVTGGIILPASAGTVTAASFTVTGAESYTYSITLPIGDVTIANGENIMTVNNFTSTPSFTGTLSGGTQVLNIGATLNVLGNQSSGTYVSADPFTVMVNYN